MFISDLDYLKSLSDSETNSVVTGGFSYFDFHSLYPVFLFNRTFNENETTGVSQGGYLTDKNGEVVGAFSASAVSYTSSNTTLKTL